MLLFIDDSYGSDKRKNSSESLPSPPPIPPDQLDAAVNLLSNIIKYIILLVVVVLVVVVQCTCTLNPLAAVFSEFSERLLKY